MAEGPDSVESDVVASSPPQGRYDTRRSIAAVLLLILLVLVVLLLLNCSGGGTTVTRSREATSTADPLAISYPPPPSTDVTGVIVPDVVGRSEPDARAAITGGQLSAGAHWMSAGQPYGTVIQQYPSAGVEVAPGTLVDLTLSTGLAGGSVSVPVAPDVLNMSESAARAKLRSLGWTFEIAYGPSTTVDAGRVFYQRPGANERTGGTHHMVVWVTTGGPAPGWPYPRPEFPF